MIQRTSDQNIWSKS